MLNIQVKNLGRIAEADIDTAPLLILVGKNDTGKSYLATLLWALAEFDTLTSFKERTRRPTWFNTILKPNPDFEPKSVLIDQQKGNDLVGFVNRILEKNATPFLQKLFAAQGFDKANIVISRKNFEPFEVIFKLSPRPKTKRPDGPNYELIFKTSRAEHRAFSIPARYIDADDWFSSFIFNQIVGFALYGEDWRMMEYSTYVPAARTGIMLALPALVGEALVAANNTPTVTMPIPVAHFLRSMARPRDATTNTVDEVREHLKRKLIRGHISANSDAASDYRYIPDGMQLKLPLHATSSMITELAPLQVALGTNAPRQHLVFEEPEAHLHLAAQREMARLIARLIKSGNRVTLTTHSDTFLQQINNLMVLHDHPNREALMEKFGYDPSDLIDPDTTKAYEFCPSEGGTVVRKVNRTNEGFVVPSLNETLLSLARETFALRGDVDA